MSASNSRVPNGLKSGIAALLILTGASSGVYLTMDHQAQIMARNDYIKAVAADNEVGMAIKIAMVMGAYYESSYKHIGTPYVDKLGKGQPLTVCNGLTGKGVVAGKYYTPADCYYLEKRRYVTTQNWLQRDLPMWDSLPVFTQATVLDFAWNKGTGAFSTSTMRRKLLAGDLEGACKENERWNRGTVNGVSAVLPGLQVRGNANADICTWGDLDTGSPVEEPQPLPENNTVAQIPAESPVAPAPTPVPTCSRWALICKLKGLFS